MKKYFTPQLQISSFDAKDVLMTSVFVPVEQFADPEGNVVPGGEGDTETDFHFLP